MNNYILRIERRLKANLIRELSEGYRAGKKEERELSLDWDIASGDGLDTCADKLESPPLAT